MNSCLDIRNSSSFLPRPLVGLSYYIPDLELLSIVMSMPLVFASCKMLLIDLISLANFPVMSNYVFAVQNFKCPSISSTTTEPLSVASCISRASIWLFVTTVAVRRLPTDDVNVLYLFCNSCYFVVGCTWLLYKGHVYSLLFY
jgi:hypothetical protein